MTHIRKWLAMTTEQAKAAMTVYMLHHNEYAIKEEWDDWSDPKFNKFTPLDFDLVRVSETTEEAIGYVFGI